MAKHRWVVLLGNENVWFVDGNPQTFASMEEALEELENFFKEEEEAVRLGYLMDTSHHEDYRIEEIT